MSLWSVITEVLNPFTPTTHSVRESYLEEQARLSNLLLMLDESPNMPMTPFEEISVASHQAADFRSEAEIASSTWEHPREH